MIPLYVAFGWLALVTIIGLLTVPKIVGFVYALLVGIFALLITIGAFGVIGGYLVAYIEEKFS